MTFGTGLFVLFVGAWGVGFGFSVAAAWIIEALRGS